MHNQIPSFIPYNLITEFTYNTYCEQYSSSLNPSFVYAELNLMHDHARDVQGYATLSNLAVSIIIP
jgi:hypothetical protein